MPPKAKGKAKAIPKAKGKAKAFPRVRVRPGVPSKREHRSLGSTLERRSSARRLAPLLGPQICGLPSLVSIGEVIVELPAT